MLDDPAEISKLDTQNMLGIVTSSPTFMEWCLKTHHREDGGRLSSLIRGILPRGGIKGIFITGMGGSAISGDVIHDWLKYDIQIPVVVVREYKLPAYVTRDWLGFVLSYSGNTEETLSSYVDAKKRGIACIGVTSGGLLESLLHQAGDVCVKVPAGHQPRAAFLFLFTSLAIAVNASKLPGLHDLVGELDDAHRVLLSLNNRYMPENPVATNPAKQLAQKIHKTTILVYGFDPYASVVRRFKGQFNENGKNPSYHDVFSELNHNETVGWEIEDTIAKSFSCIILRDPIAETKAITTRIEFTKEIIER
nr:SIS domain-containing protein [Candidatus Sigynarchaeota archaeon]